MLWVWAAHHNCNWLIQMWIDNLYQVTLLQNTTWAVCYKIHSNCIRNQGTNDIGQHDKWTMTTKNGCSLTAIAYCIVGKEASLFVQDKPADLPSFHHISPLAQCTFHVILPKYLEPSKKVSTIYPENKISHDAGQEATPGANRERTWGHTLKLQKPRHQLHRRNQFFTQRVVDHWNQLASEVILSKNTNTFKNIYNKHVLLRRGSIPRDPAPYASFLSTLVSTSFSYALLGQG